MNWIEQLENRRLLVTGGVLLVALGTLMVTAMRNPVAFDSFWHLQMGKDWIENGLSPWIDHYSYTYAGKEISNPPVAFQALLYFSTALFEVRSGFLVIKLACFILIIGAAFLALRQLKAPVVIYAIVLPMISFLLQLRAIVRPELISYLLTIVALMLYFHTNGRISLRKVLPLAALALIWTIYHRSSIVGYVIFAGFFLDCAVRQYQSRATLNVWAGWLGLGMLTFAVGFLNPGLSHPVLEAFTFSPEWKILIEEYRHRSWLFEYPGTYPLLLVTALAMILALRRREYGHLLVCLVMTYAAVDASRMISVAGIVNVLILANLLIADGFPSRWGLARRNPVRTAGILSLILIVPVLVSNVGMSWKLMDENKTTMNRYPQALVEYMNDGDMAGRVHNEFGIGGYLIYQLAHQNRFYIDGRTHILYPLEHFKRFIATTGSPLALREELDKYDVDKIIWLHDRARHDIVMEMGGFGLDFMDAGHSLYVRGPANFSMLGLLMSQPACWREGMADQIHAERLRMDVVLPWYSRLYPFADFVMGFLKASDKQTYFDNSIERMEWSDEMRRFAGFRFIEAGRNDLATFLFGGVEDHRPQDRLAAAMALLNDGEPEIAAQVLYEVSAISWPRISARDREIHNLLYLALAGTRELSSEERKIVDGLRVQPTDNSLPERSHPIDTGMFCPPGLLPAN